MKVRKNKHKILDRMANPPFMGDSNTMWFIRHVKPCKTYEKGCPDCDAIMFRKEHGRFPYTQREWFEYETRNVKWGANLMLEEMTRPPIDPEAQKLALKLIMERKVND
jgi:hypothetical protein